jgi:hypothetical protein
MSDVVTVADIEKLTPKQQEVLWAIFTNADGGHPRATLRALLEKGLIEKVEVPSHVGNLPFVVNHYRVPHSVGIPLCSWAEQNPDEEPPADDAVRYKAHLGRAS